jgi:putative transposase
MPALACGDLELATRGWVQWHNTQRLNGQLGDIPPAEFETAFDAEQTDHRQSVEIE